MSRDLLGLEGKIVMVTGAGRGFGRAIAHGYGRNGATVIAVDPDVELATGVASEVEALGATAIPIRGGWRVTVRLALWSMTTCPMAPCACCWVNTARPVVNGSSGISGDKRCR